MNMSKTKIKILGVLVLLIIILIVGVLIIRGYTKIPTTYNEIPENKSTEETLIESPCLEESIVEKYYMTDGKRRDFCCWEVDIEPDDAERIKRGVKKAKFCESLQAHEIDGAIAPYRLEWNRYEDKGEYVRREEYYPKSRRGDGCYKLFDPKGKLIEENVYYRGYTIEGSCP